MKNEKCKTPEFGPFCFLRSFLNPEP